MLQRLRPRINLRNNSYKGEGEGAWTECLFCYKSFPPNIIFKDNIKVDILSDLFSTFSKYIKWETSQEHQFDFREEQFPFCSSCSKKLVRVFKLDEQIQNVISDVISTLIINGQKQVSKKKADRASGKKMEFYRRQTIVQHQPAALVNPVVEYTEPAGLEKQPVCGFPGQSQSTKDTVSARKTPFKSSRSSKRRATAKKNARFADHLVQELGQTKFIYDNKYLFTRLKNRWQCLACDQSYDSKFDLLPHWETTLCFSSQQPVEIIETFPSHDQAIPSTSSSSGVSKPEEFQRNKISDGRLKNKQKKGAAGILDCTLCGVSFNKTYNLRRHILALHTDDSCKTFGCQVCGRKFATNVLLKDHMGIHRKIPCPICAEMHPEKYMHRHKVTQHANLISSTGTRAKLGKEHKSKVRHQKRSPPKRISGKHLKSCGKDTKVSPDISGRRDQKKSSSSVTPKIVCQLCSKIFRSKYILDVHFAKAHTPEHDKAFQCRVCGRKCLTKSLLKAHFRNHEKVECELCNRIYSVNSIYTHKYIKHKTMECTVCNENLNLDSIQEHIKRHREQNPKGRKPASWVPKSYIYSKSNKS